MTVKIMVFAGYFLVLLVIGFLARSRWSSTPQAYFLADRKLGSIVLLGTMAASNFSAFTVFGTSGAGYREGYAFFPIMGFGTGFMAVTFWIIGRKVWKIGRQRALVTPPELIRSLYGSRFVSLLFALVMLLFTVPYLALQPMAAGYALEALLGLPYFSGCVLVTAVMALYTLRGGMRAVAWTDLFQGLMMAVMLLVSLILVSRHHGGFVAANQKIFGSFPELFGRPGGLGRYTPGVWLSFLMLWFFCDPMFPQLFQRFFAAKEERTISRIMLFYPVVCTVVFFMPISIGVMGRLSFPGLAAKEADRILPMLLTEISGDAMSAMVIAAGLAALMSTMDSQLLTLSSIFTQDILPLIRKNAGQNSTPGKIFVLFLSLCGLGLAYRPPATILQIATQTFTGLAVLFPTVLFGLYFKRIYALAAAASIILGEAAVAAFYFKWLPAAGFLPVFWVMAAAFGSYLICHLAMDRDRGRLVFRVPGWLKNPNTYLLGLIFGAAVDFWAWGDSGRLLFGLPSWAWYFAGLSALQVIIMRQMTTRAQPDLPADIPVGRARPQRIATEPPSTR